MEFTAKLVVSKTNPKVRVMAVGAVVLLLGAFISAKRGYERYGLWAMGAGAAVVVLGAAMTKGRFLTSEVSPTEFAVNGWEIRMGDSTYRLDLVKDIQFYVDGYDGKMTQWGPSEGNRRVKGMDNQVRFRYCGEEQICRFYLQGPEGVEQLGRLFKEWYSIRVPFAEKTRISGRTFMMQPVKGDKELAEKKAAAGYV